MVHFWLFKPINPRTRFFLKKSSFVAFKVRLHPKFVQKIRKLRQAFSEKDSGQMDKQRVFQRTFTSWTQNCCRPRYNKFYKLFLYMLHNSTSYFHSPILQKLFYCNSCSNMVKFRRKNASVFGGAVLIGETAQIRRQDLLERGYSKVS